MGYFKETIVVRVGTPGSTMIYTYIHVYTYSESLYSSVLYIREINVYLIREKFPYVRTNLTIFKGQLHIFCLTKANFNSWIQKMSKKYASLYKTHQNMIFWGSSLWSKWPKSPLLALKNFPYFPYRISLMYRSLLYKGATLKMHPFWRMAKC